MRHGIATRTDPYLSAWRAYYKALVEAGIYVGGNPLRGPETGTTVRLKDGKRRVQDGPFADTKEQLGGFTILELPSLDAALDWAARCPAASIGAVEVRPVSSGIPAPGHRMSESSQESTHRTIERVARESYGRLVAYLSSHTRDVASAEDALSNALVKALTAWPRDGVPQNPEAWLLTTARHSLIDHVRHQQVAVASEPTLLLLEGGVEGAHDLVAEFPDERLKLLFVCAHPAIDPAMHTPLMLQTVLGLDAARIAQAFLVSPTTMGQRLVRAKTKIRDGGIPFEVPQERELPQRLDAVLEAIYAAFGIGWDDMAGVDQRGRDLAEEAIWLARVLLQSNA